MTKGHKWLFGGIGVVFAAAFFWSLWSETLYPLIKQGDTAGLMAHLLGLPLLFLGLGLFVYGGFRIVRDMFTMMGDPEVRTRQQVIEGGNAAADIHQARWRNFTHWLRALSRGGVWMLGGFLLMWIGGVLLR